MSEVYYITYNRNKIFPFSVWQTTFNDDGTVDEYVHDFDIEERGINPIEKHYDNVTEWIEDIQTEDASPIANIITEEDFFLEFI